jgi:hypothetical protein
MASDSDDDSTTSGNKTATGTAVRVSLNDQMLRDAVAAYIDETKPDPLVQQELESIGWSWNEATETTTTTTLLPTATHYLAGTVVWTGAYATVELHVKTAWQTVKDDKSEDSAQTNNGSLATVCRAVARLGGTQQPAIEAKGVTKREKKAQDRVAARMIQRLQDDAYVKKYLLDRKSSPQQLYEARILYTADGQLEERVDTDAAVATAIRRVAYFTAETDLDVFEILFSMPIMPTTALLGHRARLRLLEDAMCEACEQAGEETMVDDLDIGPAKKSKHAD